MRGFAEGAADPIAYLEHGLYSSDVGIGGVIDRGVSTAGGPMANPQDIQARPPLYREDDREERSYTTLGTVLLAILLIVVVVMFWRSCTADSRAGDSGGRGGIISDAPGVDTVDGGVAIWVKPGESVDRVLGRNGLGDATYTDLGEGTYVVSIGQMDAAALIERLKDDEGLYDAGFLFAEEKTP